MSLVDALDKIIGERVTIITKNKKKLTMVMQISRKGVYMKIMGGKKEFIALIPKEEVQKLLAPLFASYILQEDEINALWRFIVKAKKQKRKETKKKEEKEEEIELL